MTALTFLLDKDEDGNESDSDSEDDDAATVKHLMLANRVTKKTKKKENKFRKTLANIKVCIRF